MDVEQVQTFTGLPDRRTDPGIHRQRDPGPVSWYREGAAQVHPRDVVRKPRCEDECLVAILRQSQGEIPDLTLDSPRFGEVVRANQTDPHSEPSRSEGQLGWTRCHCCGASEMIDSSLVASVWVIDATCSVRSPLGTGIASPITTR